jgi:hypothetical protein
LTFLYTLAAEGVMLLHLAWIVFVVTGAVWLRRSPRWRFVHLLAVVYSVGIEAFRWICPLTYLEQALWRRAGEEAYQEAFLTHYLEKLIYAPVPQWVLVSLTVGVLAVTLVLYRRPASG